MEEDAEEKKKKSQPAKDRGNLSKLFSEETSGIVGS